MTDSKEELRKSFGRYCALYVDRFVAGLFYPAILGANLLVLFEIWSKEPELLQAHVGAALAWGLTLLLFVFDYVGVYRESPCDVPYGTISLSLIDLAAACAFAVAHFLLADGIRKEDLTVDDWVRLWQVLLTLHLLYLLWYLVRYLTRRRALGPGADDIEESYARLIRRLALLLIIQVVFFVLLSVVFWPIDQAGEYIALCLLAALFWVLRQAEEYRRSPFAEAWSS